MKLNYKNLYWFGISLSAIIFILTLTNKFNGLKQTASIIGNITIILVGAIFLVREERLKIKLKKEKDIDQDFYSPFIEKIEKEKNIYKIIFVIVFIICWLVILYFSFI